MGPYNKPLFDPQPGLVINGIILILLGLLIGPVTWHLSGNGRITRFTKILSWLCALLLIFGAAAIYRGIGFRDLFGP